MSVERGHQVEPEAVGQAVIDQREVQRPRAELQQLLARCWMRVAGDHEHAVLAERARPGAQQHRVVVHAAARAAP